MSKPTKNTSKKRQEQYVIKLGNQELVQQISKSGSIVLKGDEEEDLQNLTLQQKVKIIFILLMIPSAMVVFFGNNRFKSESSNTMMPNLPPQHLAAMGGFGGGLGVGLRGGFGGAGGEPHFHGSSRRQFDRESVRDHLNRLDPRIRRHNQNFEDSIKKERNRNKNEANNNRNNKMTDDNSDEHEKLHKKSLLTEHSNTKLPNIDQLNDEEVFRRISHQDIDSDFIQNLLLNHEDFEKQAENQINKIEFNLENEKEIKDKISANKISTQTLTEKSSSLQEDIQLGFKVILLWTPFYDSWDFVSKGSQAFIDSKCPINECTLTSDKLYYNQSDAIVFDARNAVENEIPDMRSSNQRWIFFSTEPPHNLSSNGFNYLSNIFNWSWTYRSDSDIIYSYGNVEQIMTDHIYNDKENVQMFNAFDTWRRKSKMIFWLRNSYELNTKPEIYVNELKKHIDIDIYGKCGNNSCPENPSEGKKANEDCFKTLAEQYLFAIVLDNSFCKDYVSEKVFHALEHNIIPIVISGTNYSKVMPPNSVINIINYNSPKDFADYILDIGADFNKYKTFYEWKRKYQVNYRRNDLCQLCHKLHKKDQPFKSYSNMKNWWFNESDCKLWNATQLNFE